MRYARLVFYVLVIVILFAFGFQNFESLTLGVPIRFNILGIVKLDPTTLEIWQIFLGTAVVVFAATLALDLGTVLRLRAEIWGKERELRGLRTRVEEQEAEIKRVRASSGSAAPSTPTRPATAAAPATPNTEPAPASKGLAADTTKPVGTGDQGKSGEDS